MQKISVLTVLLFLGLNSLVAQQTWDNYQPLVSSGAIPDDFTLAYAEKFAREAQQVDRQGSRKDQQRQTQFYKQSEYFLNNVLISGDIVFGDTISQFCNRVLDILLKDNPELRQDVRIYVIKSPVVNAFATNSGILFVNLGLIAQVENEAQLATVLAHELVHYKEKHVINEYLEEARIREGSDLFSSTTRDAELNQLSNYSKKLELEADQKGLNEFYNQTNYSPIEALYVMDVLQYSYLPFNEIPFEKEFLECAGYTLPRSLLLDELSPITAEDDYDDSLSSHPNIRTRKKSITNHLDLQKKGEKYLVGKDYFDYCQRLARYENTRIYLERREYGKAIYNAFLLEKTYGPDRYQQLSVAKALHALSVYKLDRKSYRVLERYRKIEGESQQCYALLSKIKPDAMATMAAAYCYQYHLEYPGESIGQKLYEQSLFNLVDLTDLRLKDFETEAWDTSGISLDSILSQNEGRSRKIARIKSKKAVSKELKEEDFYKYAFVPFMQDTAFTKTMEQYGQEVDDEPEEPWNLVFNEKVREKYDPNRALGIDKLVCVTPQYLNVDETSQEGIKYFASRERQVRYRSYLNEMANKVDLDLDLADYKDLGPTETQRFNEISLMKAWLFERFGHKNYNIVVSGNDFIEEVMDGYGTPYISTTGNFSAKQAEDIFSLITASCLVVTIPFVIADLVIPDYESFNYFFVFDVRNGNTLMADFNSYNSSDAKDFIRSIVYNNFLQVKSSIKSN
jgi:hypothetical protein